MLYSVIIYFHPLIIPGHKIISNIIHPHCRQRHCPQQTNENSEQKKKRRYNLHIRFSDCAINIMANKTVTRHQPRKRSGQSATTHQPLPNPHNMCSLPTLIIICIISIYPLDLGQLNSTTAPKQRQTINYKECYAPHSQMDHSMIIINRP